MSFITEKYRIDILDVNDADAIIIKCYDGETPYTILIDAGNMGDSEVIKKQLKDGQKKIVIDLAICTHPDNDHMGGFFDLLDDNSFSIKRFWLIDPAEYLDDNDIKNYKTKQAATAAVRQVFNKPNDSSINLIDKILSKSIDACSVISGCSHETIPIKVLAPTSKYYGEIVKYMIEDYGVQSYMESDTNKYDEQALPDKSDVKSVIDLVDDPSPFNAGSLILLFEPGDGKKFLFAGDANCASLANMIEIYGKELKNITILKVPHHGSKHNMSTEIIASFSPMLSIISAAGTKKHPNSGIVYWLSKYGNVYSTHKSGSLHYPKTPDENSAIPLRKKE